MKATVSAIIMFCHGIDGPNCPKCNNSSAVLSTTNEWCYWCKKCNIRFDIKNRILDEQGTH